MLDAVPHRPELLALIADGFDIEMIVSTAVELSSTRGAAPKVGYLVGTVRGRVRDSQNSEVSYAGSSNRRQSVCEQIEQQIKEHDERERQGGSHLSIVR